MRVTMSYRGHSGLHSDRSGSRILQLAPNLARDAVAFDAALRQPLRFREAISALHDIVINDLTFHPKDKTAYELWKREQARRELAIRQEARQDARNERQTAWLRRQPS